MTTAEMIESLGLEYRIRFERIRARIGPLPPDACALIGILKSEGVPSTMEFGWPTDRNLNPAQRPSSDLFLVTKACVAIVSGRPALERAIGGMSTKNAIASLSADRREVFDRLDFPIPPLPPLLSAFLAMLGRLRETAFADWRHRGSLTARPHETSQLHLLDRAVHGLQSSVVTPTVLESAILERLSGEHHLPALCAQPTHVVQRLFTGQGSLTEFRRQTEPSPALADNQALHASINIPGRATGLSATLFIQSGGPHQLELASPSNREWDGSSTGFSFR